MKFDEVDFTAKTKDGKDKYRLLKSGAVFDIEQRHIIARRITPDEGREMANARWAKYRRATASRVLKEAMSIDPDVKTEEDAWALLVARVYQQIMDSDKPRGEDLEKVGKAMGAMPNITDVRQADQAQPEDYEARRLIRELASIVGNALNRDVVEGRVINE
jgi:hypothetical protein